MRRLVPGMSAFRKSRALIQICMLARAVPLRPRNRPAARFIRSTPLLPSRQSSPRFRTATVSSGRASRRKPCCSPARTDPAPPISPVRGTITAVPGGDAILADALLPWKNGGYAAFRHESAGQMALALYDSSLKKTAERTFGRSTQQCARKSAKLYRPAGEKPSRLCR